jgi:magnesium transporter
MLPTEGTLITSVWSRLVFYKNNVLISFQEKQVIFSHIRERIRTIQEFRTKKPIFLLYLLLDAVMENFYVTIENEEDKG